MKNRKLKVTIGIPAYNEEANIKKLLLSLLAQKRSNFVLEEIIVVSDKSTDATVNEIRSIRNHKIKLLKNNKRLGQAGGQNKIIKIFKSEVLVLLNADVLPSNNTCISKLISPFQYDKTIGLVGAKLVPLTGLTFFENILNFSISLKDSIFEKVNKGSNLYLCRGAARAFKKELAKKIYWKDSLSEDTFSYLSCIKEGYKFKYVFSAVIYFKSPDNFNDHLKQSARFILGPEVMLKFFDRNLVKSAYAIPKKIALITMAEYVAKNPLLFFSYLFTLVRIRINPGKRIFAQSTWDISQSSKNLSHG